MSPTVLPTAPRETGGIKGSHVLAGFLAFFAVIFAVNGSMIYRAVSTNSGLVANEPYRKGLHYNDRIAASERQALLHWTEGAALDRDGRISITLETEAGAPVRGLAINAVVGRPSTNRADIALKLSEVAPGRYEASAGALEAGAWLLAFEARVAEKAEDPIYRARRRMWLKP